MLPASSARNKTIFKQRRGRVALPKEMIPLENDDLGDF